MSTAASAPSSITHLEILWPSLDELCSDLTADEWRLQALGQASSTLWPSSRRDYDDESRSRSRTATATATAGLPRVGAAPDG